MTMSDLGISPARIPISRHSVCSSPWLAAYVAAAYRSHSTASVGVNPSADKTTGHTATTGEQVDHGGHDGILRGGGRQSPGSPRGQPLLFRESATGSERGFHCCGWCGIQRLVLPDPDHEPAVIASPSRRTCSRSRAALASSLAAQNPTLVAGTSPC